MATNSGETGTRDTTYNLISVTYHCLQSAETCSQYFEDARRDGNEELTSFFEETQRTQRECADPSQELLKTHFARS